MPDQLNPPQPLNGCISMWFSKTGSRHKWVSIAGSTALSSYFFEHEDDFWACKKSAATPEGEQIISLANELAQKEARIKELENALEDLATCARSLDITEQTHDPSDCEFLGELLATAESLLTGGQNA